MKLNLKYQRWFKIWSKIMVESVQYHLLDLFRKCFGPPYFSSTQHVILNFFKHFFGPKRPQRNIILWAYQDLEVLLIHFQPLLKWGVYSNILFYIRSWFSLSNYFSSVDRSQESFPRVVPKNHMLWCSIWVRNVHPWLSWVRIHCS